MKLLESGYEGGGGPAGRKGEPQSVGDPRWIAGSGGIKIVDTEGKNLQAGRAQVTGTVAEVAQFLKAGRAPGGPEVDEEALVAERGLPLNEHRQPNNPLQWLLSDERRQLVRDALKQLQPRDAELLLLKYTENWSYQEIADHLNMTISAVESRLHRARKRMRQVLTSAKVTEV